MRPPSAHRLANTRVCGVRQAIKVVKQFLQEEQGRAEAKQQAEHLKSAKANAHLEAVARGNNRKALKASRVKAAVTLQVVVRGWMALKAKAVMALQAVVRGWRCRARLVAKATKAMARAAAALRRRVVVAEASAARTQLAAVVLAEEAAVAASTVAAAVQAAGKPGLRVALDVLGPACVKFTLQLPCLVNAEAAAAVRMQAVTRGRLSRADTCARVRADTCARRVEAEAAADACAVAAVVAALEGRFAFVGAGAACWLAGGLLRAAACGGTVPSFCPCAQAAVSAGGPVRAPCPALTSCPPPSPSSPIGHMPPNCGPPSIPALRRRWLCASSVEKERHRLVCSLHKVAAPSARLC